jgi:hypothetical protein
MENGWRNMEIRGHEDWAKEVMDADAKSYSPLQAVTEC